MAIYYFRNTGNTDWGTSTNWSLTDGGGATGLVPTATDDAYFTANSGNATVTVTNKVCNNLITTGFTGTISCTTALTISGNVTLSATTTIAGTGFFSFSSATSNTYTRNNATINVDNVRVVGTGTYTFADTWGVKTFIFNSAGAILNGNTLNISVNLTMSQTSGAGTTQINLTGTGTWSGTGVLRNNLTINTAGTIIISGSVAYNTGTLLYTAGTVTTTGSTLNIGASTALNTNGINWNNIVTSGTTTITLSSNLSTTNLTIATTSSLTFTIGINTVSISNTLTINGSSTLNLPSNIQVTNLILGTGVNAPITINGVFNLLVSGNLTQNHGAVQVTSGTSTIVLNGTGTWSNASTGPLQNNLIINTSGTITISGSVYYQTGTLTYLNGTTITTGSTLVLYSAPTLTTNNMSWNNILFASNGSYSMTLGSNLYLDGTFTIGGNGAISGSYNIYCGNFTINNSTSGATVVVATMSQTVYVYNTLTFGTSASGTGSNGAVFYVFGSLTLGNGGGNSGTSQVIMVGTGTVSGTNTFNHPLTINTSGIITFSTVFNIASTFTCTSGIVRASITTLNCAPASGQLLIGMNKIVWKNVVLTSGQTFTMNEFFSGSATTKTTISASSTTNYTITFQDTFEKIAKFVAISGATITRRNQLLVITDSKKSSTNLGIRYINNLPNGIAKGKPSVSNTLTPRISTFLVADPAMSIK